MFSFAALYIFVRAASFALENSYLIGVVIVSELTKLTGSTFVEGQD